MKNIFWLCFSILPYSVVSFIPPIFLSKFLPISRSHQNRLRSSFFLESSIQSLDNFFKTTSSNSHFRDTFWQKTPHIFEFTIPESAFQMVDLKFAVDTDFLEAGRGTFQDGRSGWNMAPVSAPKGKSFQDAKLQFNDVLMALTQKNGTVVFNSAGGFIPKLAVVCLDSTNSLQLPLAVNMYLTNPGQQTSAPPHTDKQDVFVFQQEGYKRWRVYAPPAPSRMQRADPFARGKGLDVLSFVELAPPLLDLVLGPGQVLYVPAGFPHTTDTLVPAEFASSGPSLHLTVGVDCLIWGLTFAHLRGMALRRAGLDDKLQLTKLEPPVFWRLHNSLPLGFLSSEGVSEEERAKEIEQQLITRMCEAEPRRWTSPAEAQQQVDALPCIHRLLQHHRDITATFKAMYADVGFKQSPVSMDLSLFRSQPYFLRLEETMGQLQKWVADNQKTPADAAAGKARGKSKRR